MKNEINRFTIHVAYTALDKVKLDPVIAFPPIRIFGTIGFICSMLLTDILGFQNNYMQFFSALPAFCSASCFALIACSLSSFKFWIQIFLFWFLYKKNLS